MNVTIEPVLATLRQLLERHRELKAAIVLTQQAIVDRQLETLSMHSMQVNRLLQAIGELEQQRLLGVSNYLVKRGLMATTSFRMKQLIQLVYEAEEKQQLLELAEALNEELAELKELNRFNQQLLRLDLENVSHAIDLIIGPSEEEATYHGSLQANAFIRTGKIDAKA